MWLWSVIVGGMLVSNVCCFTLGKYWGLYKVFRAEQQGRIAVIKLPSKKEIEGMLKKAQQVTLPAPAPKKEDLLN